MSGRAPRSASDDDDEDAGSDIEEDDAPAPPEKKDPAVDAVITALKHCLNCDTRAHPPETGFLNEVLRPFEVIPQEATCLAARLREPAEATISKMTTGLAADAIRLEAKRDADLVMRTNMKGGTKRPLRRHLHSAPCTTESYEAMRKARTESEKADSYIARVKLTAAVCADAMKGDVMLVELDRSRARIVKIV